MKKLVFSALIVTCCGLAASVHAQTPPETPPAPPAAATPSPPPAAPAAAQPKAEGSQVRLQGAIAPVTKLISLDPLWLFYLTAAFQLENQLNERSSLVTKLRVGQQNFEDGKRTVLGLGLAWHFFPRTISPGGFFASPGVDFLMRLKSSQAGSSSYWAIAPYVEIGYNWIYDSGFYWGANVGVMYGISQHQEDSFDLSNISGIIPRMGLHFGFGF